MATNVIPADSGRWAEHEQSEDQSTVMRLGFEGWIVAFYVLCAVVLSTSLGLKLTTVAAAAVLALIVGAASMICSTERLSYWQSMRAIAALNVTGDFRFGQFLVMPLLLVASLYSIALSAASIIYGRASAQRRWLHFVRRVNALAQRLD